MRLYVIGPVTGRENLNRAAFEEARAKLERAGYSVTTPHDIIPPDASHEDAMRESIGWITRRDRDGVAMLKEWDLSAGARFEYKVAVACGIRVHCMDTWLLMADDDPENHSPEETQNPPSDGVLTPSDEALGALTHRMDETNVLLRAVYHQIAALAAIGTGALAKSTCSSPKNVVDRAFGTASDCLRTSKACFESAGKENQDGRA